MSQSDLPELLQFSHSHFNEKVRWALDFKQLPHVRRSLLPGPHMPVVRRLTGASEVPVLLDGGLVVAGSAKIIDHIENHHPGAHLYPEDPLERTAALEMQRWLDSEIGAPVRCAYFCDVLPDHAYMGRMFAWGQGGVAGRLYEKSFGAIHIALKRLYRLTPENAEAGRRKVSMALDQIASETQKSGYLVGSQFSVADLTAAALLMLCVHPPEYPVPLFEPVSPEYSNWLERWQDHPALEWIRRMYAEHRGQSAEVTA